MHMTTRPFSAVIVITNPRLTVLAKHRYIKGSIVTKKFLGLIEEKALQKKKEKFELDLILSKQRRL